MKRAIALLTLLICASTYLFAGGPWTQNKNEGIIIGNFSPVIYKNYTSSDGETIDMRRRVI